MSTEYTARHWLEILVAGIEADLAIDHLKLAEAALASLPRWIEALPDDESTWPPVGISVAWMNGALADVWRGSDGPGLVVTPLRARIMRQWPNRMLGTKDADPPRLFWQPYPEGPTLT